MDIVDGLRLVAGTPTGRLDCFNCHGRMREAADVIESLRAELAELRRFRKAIMDYDSNLYDALADSDAAHKGEGE